MEGKCYLRGVTAIDPDWLPDLCASKCTFIPPAGKTAEPWFDADSGQMMRRMHVTFGRPRSFPLPDRDVPYPSERAGDDLSDPIFAAHFARFLMDSKAGVLPKLTPLLDKVLCIPSTFVTVSSHNQRREVAVFLKALAEKNVFSRRSLEKALEDDSNFLKAEFKGLVPKARHKDVESVWPPLCYRYDDLL